MRSFSFITLSLAFAASNAREWKPIFSCPGHVPTQLPPKEKSPYDSLLEKEKLFDIKNTATKTKETIKMENKKKKAFGVEPPIPVSPTFTVVGVQSGNFVVG
jgi:hypothetical protein